MEDRLAPGLYLEMTDGELDEYAATRVPALLDDSQVLGATWWRNVHRDRDDLPRVLDEFSHLGVYEVRVGFSPPSVPQGVQGLHMVRTPRPGQGVISGRPTIGLSLVLISPDEESRAQELRDWADFVHIRHIAEAGVPGYTMITPYVNAEPAGHPRFMHFYEMDCRDPERAFKSMTPIVAARMGGLRSDYFRMWANGPGLRIMYVNSFERVGEAHSTTEFFDVAARQRAYRAFTDQPVDDATIERLIDGAIRAPSAENRQPWEFVVVRDATARGAIGDLMARAWDGGGREHSQHRLSPALLADVDSAMHGGVAAAPVIVVVCFDLERGDERTMGSSIFPAVQNLLLGATTLGLGATLTTIATVFSAELRKLLTLPDRVQPVAVVPVGHPARQLGPSKREPAATRMHRDTYGTPWS